MVNKIFNLSKRISFDTFRKSKYATHTIFLKELLRKNNEKLWITDLHQ